MAIIAYLRVSTEQQTQSGAGLDAQLDACQRMAGKLAGVYRDEGVSGKTGLDKRPSLLEAIAQLSKGDTLIVAKRDRLGRDPLVVAMIEAAVTRKGARIVSAAGEGTDSDSPTDILMRRMVDAFAEYERLVIGARTRAALQAKKARGERTGSIPYGFHLADDGVNLVPDDVEQEAIAMIRELNGKGLSLRNIAGRLEAKGYKPRNGKSWHPQTISNILEAA
jgi:DNA invertase Pin-like site-specific DNA recombinase